MPDAMRVSAVILAAGAGTRLGGVAKALLERGDQTFLSTILSTAREAGALSEAIVVVGAPFGDAVAAHARSLGARVVENSDPSRGMASSVALGFTALSPTADAAWLWPVDHPDVRAATLRALCAALGDHDVAQPRFGDRGGHPPLIARGLWPRLGACGELAGGARSVIAMARVVPLAVDDAGVVLDFDTPDRVTA